LLPDDEIVLVTRHWDLIDNGLGQRPFQELIDHLTEASDAIVIVDVSDVSSVLVENGTWIATRISAQVREVLEAPAHPRLSRGQRFTLEMIEGGEVRIGKVIVKADDLILPRAKRQYLMFVSLETGIVTPTQSPLLIQDGRLVKIEPGDDSADRFGGLSLRDVREALRRSSPPKK
jgi:hypothetical protein